MPEDLAYPVCSMTDLLEVESAYECATCGHEWERGVEASELVDPAQNAGHEIDAKAAGMGVLIRAQFVRKA